MKIYHYRPGTKEFLQASEARIDPLETQNQGTDIYLIPAHATLIVPPRIGENEAAVFDGESWEIVPDHRGAEYYLENGQRIEIAELGETIPGNALLEPPEPPPPTESELIELKIQAETRAVAIERLKAKKEIPEDYK